MEQQRELTKESLSRHVSRQRMESVLCEETTDSTNRILKEMAKAGAKEGQVVIADEQTEGRGRMGNTFFSPKGQGIYMSALLRPDDKAYEMAPLTSWAAVAVANAIESVCGVRPGIKWVNDLVLNGKKICGIMTELAVKEDGETVDYVVVGIGVNVNGNQEDFPEELREIASSLQAVLGAPVPRAQLAAEIIREIDLMSEHWQIAAIKYLAQYRQDCVTIGKEVRVISGNAERTATAIAVEGDFSLAVRYEDGTEEKINSGEVRVRGLYGYI